MTTSRMVLAAALAAVSAMPTQPNASTLTPHELVSGADGQKGASPFLPIERTLLSSRMSTERARGDENKETMRLIDLSLQKGGTSSIVDYAWREFGLSAFHDQLHTLNIMKVNYEPMSWSEACANAADVSARTYPDYAGWRAMLDSKGLLATALSAPVNVWADTPFGLLMHTFENVYDEKAKYVIWDRPADDWISSFEKFFCGPPGLPFATDNAPTNATWYHAQVFKLTYGVCDPCDAAGGGRSEVIAANMVRVKAAYENHLKTVREYFAATPQRASRLHVVDFLNDPLDGQHMCEFVFSAGDSRCAGLTDIPDVQQDEVSAEMLAESEALWDAAIGKLSSTSAAAATAAPAAVVKAGPTRAHDTPAHSFMRAPRSGTFTVAQLQDVHLGAAAFVDNVAYGGGSSHIDDQRLAAVRKVLAAQPPGSIDLAVLGGDQIQSANLEWSQLAKWRELTDMLAGMGLAHTSILGNHDAEPFMGSNFELAGGVQPLNATEAEWARGQQDVAGAQITRDALMAADATSQLSRTRLAPARLGSASSAYVLDVLPHGGAHTPLLSIYHLDAGGGGIPKGIEAEQSEWFVEELTARRRSYPLGSAPPAIVFSHYPFDILDAYFLSGTVPCWGERHDDDGGSVTADAIVDAIARGSEVAGVFVGHKHCNNYCCAANGTNFCFGAHSSTGGYVCDANDIHVDSVQIDSPGTGVRLIELTAPSDGTWRVETRIALVNGSTVHRRVLAEGRYPKGDHAESPERMTPTSAGEDLTGGAAQLDRSSEDPRVIDLSLQKGGSSSFAAFAYSSLGLVTWHSHGKFMLDMGLDVLPCDALSNGAAHPDYDGWQQALNSTGKLSAALKAPINAWADSPVGVYMPFDRLDTFYNHRAKFVLWERPAAEWAASFESFMCFSNKSFEMYEARASAQQYKLSYGICDVCDFYGGQRRHVIAANMRRVQAAYERHLAAVHDYFDATPARRARIQYMDYYGDALDGLHLCEFVYGGGDPRCAGLTDIPDVEVQTLPEAMIAQSEAAWDAAVAALA